MKTCLEIACAVIGWSPVTMITCWQNRNVFQGYKTHLDAGAPALSHCIGNGGLGRVNHAHQADEAEAVQGKVGLVPISRELETLGEVGRVEVKVDKAEDTLTHTSQGLAGLGEGVLHLLGQSHHLPLQQDCVAP